ncbi:MAG: glycosyltransferase family 4 protein [Terriglobales bacterium]
MPSGVDLVTFDDDNNRVVSALCLARRTLKVISEFDPHIVHIHSTFAGAILRPLLAGRRCRATIIFCPHGWAFDRDVGPLARRCMKWLERLWSHWCDAIVCVSEHERKAGAGIGIVERKLVLIRNGLPSRAPAAAPVSVDWPNDTTRLLFVGRFDRQKGIDILFAALRDIGHEIFAVIAGDSLRAGLGELPSNARYAGWLTPGQLEAYYRRAEVVVMPSRWEGLPLVALEAMRAGVPIIASGVGGLPEIVEDGKTGILIRRTDKESLVETLRSLKTNPLRAMGEAGRRRFLDNFTIDDAHTKLFQLYVQHAPSLEEAELNDSSA